MSLVAQDKRRAPRNRTITVLAAEHSTLKQLIVQGSKLAAKAAPYGTIVHGDAVQCAEVIPENSVDLLILDPPYNLTKQFNGTRFSKKDSVSYADWMRRWLEPVVRRLKRTASVYICSDWSTSGIVHDVASEFLTIRNRITWEREKGRGALRNWKNCSEDIWFCTVSDDFTFNVDAVKLKRRVVAPYRVNGEPKDWKIDNQGAYRMTSPSNLWTDITVPFWSMPENTDHPTQKPEKLIAKLVLASSRDGDLVLDPFLGSGTTSAVCEKLGRQHLGIEIDENYCLLAAKRLRAARRDKAIQGLQDGVFLERNTLTLQMRQSGSLDEAVPQ